ncbi:7938_t:CDS:1, partial [Racocetra fulgida]
MYGGARDVYDMFKLDTLNLIWSKFSPGSMAPIGVVGYSATLLNNASILYIGGQPGGDVNTLPYALLDK